MARDTAARPSYEQALADFSIERGQRQLHGDLQTGINACVECCGRSGGRSTPRRR